MEHQHTVYDSDSNDSEADDDDSINDATEVVQELLQYKTTQKHLEIATAALQGDLSDISGVSFPQRLPKNTSVVDVEQLTPVTKAGYLLKSPYRG